MANHRKTHDELAEENVRLRAQVAQLEDRLDHLTEHGAAAQAAHQWEALHRAVMNALSEVALITDDSGRLVYVSPNAQYIFGDTEADILRQGRISALLPSELFDPDVLARRREIANIECRIRDAVGRARNLLVTVRRIDDISGGTVLYACRDVTERKKVELDHKLLSLTFERRVEERTQELRQSRERYRRLVEGLRDEYFFYATDSEGILTYVSPAVHTIVGFTPAEVTGHNWREFVDPTSPTFAQIEEYERMRFAGLPTPKFLAAIRHANGGVRLLELRDAPVYDADGRVIASEGIAKDVTQREQAAEQLRRAHDELERRVAERTAELTTMNERLRASEQRYRSLVEDHPEFITRWRDEGMLTFVNEAVCRYFGTPRDELIGESFLPMLVEQDRELFKAKVAQVSVDNPVFIDEHRVVLPGGRTVWLRWTNRALFNKEGTLIEFQAVGSDITERRKVEEHAREQGMARAQLATLTSRERDVMRLVVAGDANKVIARKLGLSVKTIEKHRSSLMRKLRVRSVPTLVRLAMLAEEDNE
jgi:PAS domain S-box-containing protein